MTMIILSRFVEFVRTLVFPCLGVVKRIEDRDEALVILVEPNERRDEKMPRPDHQESLDCSKDPPSLFHRVKFLTSQNRHQGVMGFIDNS